MERIPKLYPTDLIRAIASIPSMRCAKGFIRAHVFRGFFFMESLSFGLEKPTMTGFSHILACFLVASRLLLRPSRISTRVLCLMSMSMDFLFHSTYPNTAINRGEQNSTQLQAGELTADRLGQRFLGHRVVQFRLGSTRQKIPKIFSRIYMCMWSGVTVTYCDLVQCLPGASPIAIWAHSAHRHLFCIRPLVAPLTSDESRHTSSHVVTHRHTSSFGDIFAAFCYLQEHPIVESGWSAAIRVPCRLCGGGRSSTTLALGMAAEEVCKGVHMNLHILLGIISRLWDYHLQRPDVYTDTFIALLSMSWFQMWLTQRIAKT